MDWLWVALRRFQRQALVFILGFAVFVFALSVVMIRPAAPSDVIGFVLIALATGLAMAPMIWINWTYGYTGEDDIRGLRLLALLGLAILWALFVGALGGAVFWIADRI